MIYHEEDKIQRGGDAMWRTLAGAGVLAVRDGRVLMVLHLRGGQYRWELPSGYVHLGESLEETAAREAIEETSVPVQVGRLFCTVLMDVPDEEYRGINAYFCAQPLGIVQPKVINADHEPIIDAAYIDVSSIRTRDLHPVDRKILARWSRDPDTPPFYFRMLF